MRLILALAALTGAFAASANTVPPELAVIGEPATILNATYSVGSTNVSFKPGEFLNATTAHDPPQPQLHDSGLSSSGPYLLLMVDPDWNVTSPPSVIVHTVVTNLTTNVNSTSEAKVIASYIAPAPSSGTHNYTLFLFDQPSNFSIPSAYESYMETTAQTPYNRLNLPLENFIKQAGLGKPVAANYFRVSAASNSSATSTTTGTPSGTATSTAASNTNTSSAAAIRGNSYLATVLALFGAAVAIC